MMRSKEGAIDYRYFPEPNITPVLLDENWIKDVVSNLPELPVERAKRYRKLGLPENQIEVLVAQRELSSQPF